MGGTPSAMFTNIPVRRVRPLVFEELEHLKDTGGTPAHLRFLGDEYGNLVWEHTFGAGASYESFTIVPIPHAHALADLRVHVPGATQNVQLHIHGTVFDFKEFDGNYWVMTTFTQAKPYFVGEGEPPRITISPQEHPSEWRVSCACIRYTSDLAARLRIGNFFLKEETDGRTRNHVYLGSEKRFHLVEDDDPKWQVLMHHDPNLAW